MRFVLAALAAAFMATTCLNALAQSTQPSAPPPPPPNCHDAAHRALDFWIGEWDAYRAANNHFSGRSSITASDEGCVINEHWTSPGQTFPYSGRSLNTLDAVSGKWEQYWPASTGAHIHFVGGVQAGGVIMATTGPNDTSPGPNGQPQWQRVPFTPLPDGTVKQQGDVSDDGKTCTVAYALIYRHHTS